MQFVVDPLPLLQFYHTLSTTTPTCDMLVASKVRSYLGLPDLLPPLASLPSANPTQFQKLDHTFTRKQWLPTIHSCRSFTNTGYPSDHYLLVTTLQVRLAARPRKPPGSLKLHIGNPDDAQKDAFNAALQDLLFPEQEPPTPATDHNARVKYFTDGSGSRGKCTKHTLAGWGWSHCKEGLWVEASGPVITDHNAPDYMGAEVGSNNTGELTAIAEALLHAKEHQHTPHIHTDSLWSINVLTGRWRPQRHKQLVGYIKSIISSFTCKVRFQWVQGHAGHEGNEKADTLAERGKNTRTRSGGRTLLPPARPQREAPDSLNPDHFVTAMHNAARKVFQAKARKSTHSLDHRRYSTITRRSHSRKSTRTSPSKTLAQQSQEAGKEGPRRLGAPTTGGRPRGNDERSLERHPESKKGLQRRSAPPGCTRKTCPLDQNARGYERSPPK